MLDLTLRALPNAVLVNGRAFSIKTDYRVWLKFEREYKNSIITHEPFSVDYLFDGDTPQGIVTDALLEFARPQSELPRPVGAPKDVIVIDFDIDADLIYSAFMEQYHIDLFEVNLHWHKFLALLKGLNDNTHLSKVMGYRCYEKSDKKRDIRDELKRAWEIKPPITAEEQAELDEFNSIFN